jgi:hypothetical protein
VCLFSPPRKVFCFISIQKELWRQNEFIIEWIYYTLEDRMNLWYQNKKRREPGNLINVTLQPWYRLTPVNLLKTMILLQQNKKSRESGGKMSLENYDGQWILWNLTWKWTHIMCHLWRGNKNREEVRGEGVRRNRKNRGRTMKEFKGVLKDKFITWYVSELLQ